MNPAATIIMLVVGLPLLAVLIGIAIGSHFGDTTGSEDPHP